MITNNVEAGWWLKGQTLLIAETFQEMEAIDVGVAADGAGTGIPDKSLSLKKT